MPDRALRDAADRPAASAVERSAAPTTRFDPQRAAASADSTARVGTAARLDVVGLTKWYGNLPAVAEATLSIGAGEFFTLLGPTGSGKTTLIRLLGGFEAGDAGNIMLGGSDISGVPPERRPVSTVFATPTLFPRQSVADNVAFGLKFRSSGKRGTAARKVNDLIGAVGLTDVASHRAGELSAAEQQLVALARCLVTEPAVVLLDDPFAGIDSRTRRSVLPAVRAAQRESGTTFIYATQDATDALSLSDRLAVLGAGQVLQVGTPRQVYDQPGSAFIADVLGVANLLRGYVLSPGLVEIAGTGCPADTGDISGDCTVIVRPERAVIAQPGTWAGAMPGLVTDASFAGSTTTVIVHFGDHVIQASITNDGEQWIPAPGADVEVVLPREALRVVR